MSVYSALNPSQKLNKIAVTGASGFVGKALVSALSNLGFNVVAICRSKISINSDNVTLRTLDLSCQNKELNTALSDCQAIFHVAAKVDMWGPYHDFYQANVVGTRNVIQACREVGIQYLIYTSSPSVVADGKDLNGIDESYPIPSQHHADYPATKALAEKEVLAANSKDLKTISLRPHLIFGPGDRHFVPSIVDRAERGRMLIVGDGRNIVDFSFIDDCIQAHLCALNSLVAETPDADGRAYFISQGEPTKLWQFIDSVLEIYNLPPLSKRISRKNAMRLAGIFEGLARYSPVKFKPLFTKFLVSEMTTNHYFNITAAKKFLGYQPQFTMQAALARLQTPS